MGALLEGGKLGVGLDSGAETRGRGEAKLFYASVGEVLRILPGLFGADRTVVIVSSTADTTAKLTSSVWGPHCRLGVPEVVHWGS